jgi:hypothetical protein
MAVPLSSKRCSMGLLNIFYYIQDFTSSKGCAETQQPRTEAHTLTPPPRHTRPPQAGSGQQPRADHTPQKKAGRPNGAPSPIVTLRISVDLLAQLDRDIDRLEVQTGLKANRGMIARRALALLLETHCTGRSALLREETKRESLGPGLAMCPLSSLPFFVGHNPPSRELQAVWDVSIECEQVDSSVARCAEPGFSCARPSTSPDRRRVDRAARAAQDRSDFALPPFWHDGTERPIQRPQDSEEQEEY